MALADHDPERSLSLLFRFGLDGWRKGVVDHLSAHREVLTRLAPRDVAALSELGKPAIKRAIDLLDRIHEETPTAIPMFTAAYGGLRFGGLYMPDGRETASILHSAIDRYRVSSSAALMARRALERPLHLLRVPDEWDAFISRLLDWIEDPRGEGAVFAAYTASYYLDCLDAGLWNGLAEPYSIRAAWTSDALHTVLKESDKNLNEPWYAAAHHRTINTLRALNYIRAHPNPTLSHYGKIVSRRLAHAGLAAVRTLSHSRRVEITTWCQFLESIATKP